MHPFQPLMPPLEPDHASSVWTISFPGRGFGVIPVGSRNHLAPACTLLHQSFAPNTPIIPYDFEELEIAPCGSIVAVRQRAGLSWLESTLPAAYSTHPKKLGAKLRKYVLLWMPWK